MLAWTKLEAGKWRVVESFRMTGLGDCFGMVCNRQRGLVRKNEETRTMLRLLTQQRSDGDVC